MSAIIRNVSSAIVYLFLALIATSTAEAGPYDVRLQGDKSALRSLATSGDERHSRRTGHSSDVSTRREIKPVRLSAHVPRLGRVSFTFTHRKVPTWRTTFRSGARAEADRSNIVLLQGNAMVRRSHSRITPASAAMFSNGAGMRLEIQLQAGSSERRGRFYTLRIPLGSTVYGSASSIPDSYEFRCGSDEGRITPEHRPSYRSGSASGSLTSQPLPILEISAQGDASWYQKFGEASNEQMALAINAAEVLYKEQLGVEFQIIELNTFTSDPASFGTLGIDALLQAFSSHVVATSHLGEADLYHLFTAKPLDGSSVGLAWIDRLCSPSKFYRTGLTEFRQNFVHRILAHELGHNFGANHAASVPETIMSPRINASDYFSLESAAAMSADILNTSSCLYQHNERDRPLRPLGDYDGSGCVDQNDHAAWRAAFGTTCTPGTDADGNGDGVIDLADYVVWRSNMGNGC